MNYPKKIYLCDDVFDMLPFDKTEYRKNEYISVADLKEWEIKTKEHLFEKFDGHISIGISIVFDELLNFIEEK